MEIENFDKTRVKFLVEIKHKIFRFNSLSGHDAKVSHLLTTNLEILVASTQFSLALATSWSQFRTLYSLNVLRTVPINRLHVQCTIMKSKPVAKSVVTYM